MYFKDRHQHQKEHSKMVKSSLKSVAKKQRLAYQIVFHDFVSGDIEEVTLLFWDELFDLFPHVNGKYNRVDYCQTCKRFNLYSEGNSHVGH